jgi:hypothetical protein
MEKKKKKKKKKKKRPRDAPPRIFHLSPHHAIDLPEVSNFRL